MRLFLRPFRFRCSISRQTLAARTPGIRTPETGFPNRGIHESSPRSRSRAVGAKRGGPTPPRNVDRQKPPRDPSWSLKIANPVNSDPSGLETLCRQHTPALFPFLLNLTRNEADARDLLQDLFISLARIPRSALRSGRSRSPRPQRPHSRRSSPSLPALGHGHPALVPFTNTPCPPHPHALPA